MRVPGDRGNASRQAGRELYAAAVAAARHPTLYVRYGVADTLDGRFEMVALHLFALTHRLMHDPGDDPELARLVSETFVTDMDGTFREMGVGDMSVPKKMRSLYSAFAGRLTAYGAALKEGGEALGLAVARNVFPDEPPDQRARHLASHLATTVASIREAALSELKRGRVEFPPPRALPAEAHR